MNRLRWCFPLLLYIFGAAMPGAGQGYRGALIGRITDNSGRVVPAARVMARNRDTGREHIAKSDPAGDYLITHLEPASYDVTVTAPNFKAWEKQDVPVPIDAVLRINAVLQLASILTEITVRDAPPAIQTENGALGAVVSVDEVRQLPLNRRDYRTLALLTPGVVPSPAGANPHHINGARSDHVSYLIDGIASMDRRGNLPAIQPPLDAIREFKVLTSSFSAEYGRISGGIISVALRSGQNDIHGSVFEFLRNDVLDARGFFDAAPPRLRRNQFGGTVTGPVARGKLFFSLSFEGLRSREHETRLSRVPTQAMREGVVGVALDPLTGAPFAGGVVPAERIDPVAHRLLSFYPLPNREGPLNFATSGGVVQSADTGLARFDFDPSAHSRFSARVIAGSGRMVQPFRTTTIPGFGSVVSERGQHWGLNFTRVLSPSATNEFRVGFARAAFRDTARNEGRNTSADIGISGVAPGTGLASVSVTGYSPIGDPAPLPDEWTDNEFLVSNTTSLARNGHWLRWGGEVQRSQHFNLFTAYRGGQLVFLGNATRNPLADLLLGLPAFSQRQIGTNKSYLFSTFLGAFIQDDWRVHPRLTLNLGLRYDLPKPPVEKYDRWANFLPHEGRSVLATEPGRSRSLMHTDWTNIAPRFGFAWRADRAGTTALRGGYGIFYALDLQFTMYQLLAASAYPFTNLQIYQASAVTPVRLASPFPEGAQGVAPGAASPNGWEFKNRSPYQQQWNLTIARELTSGIGVEAAYAGSKGTHQSIALNLNQTIRTNAGPVVPYAGYGRIIWQSLSGNAAYHALQITARRHFGSNFSFRSSLTWSKAIDYASFGSAARQPQDPRDLQAERGLCDFHRGRTWTTDAIAVVPIGRGRKIGANLRAPLNLLLGGWRLSGILRLYDGLPFTPVVASANQQAGEPVRPDRAGVGTLSEPSVNRWFNKADFTVVPSDAFRMGNSGRNILIGPGKFILDAALMKEAALGSESRRLQLRLEAFNALNRANFGQPNPAVDVAAGGAISTADPGRQLQIAVKVLF